MKTEQEIFHDVLANLTGDGRPYDRSMGALIKVLVFMVVAAPKVETCLDAVDALRALPAAIEPWVYDVFDSIKQSTRVEIVEAH